MSNVPTQQPISQTGLRWIVILILLVGCSGSIYVATKASRRAEQERQRADQSDQELKQLRAQTEKQIQVLKGREEEARKKAENLAKLEKIARQRAERLLYVQQISEAARAWRDKEKQAPQLPEIPPRDLKGWEWHYLRTQIIPPDGKPHKIWKLK